jgi:hypothetical protein
MNTLLNKFVLSQAFLTEQYSLDLPSIYIKGVRFTNYNSLEISKKTFEYKLNSVIWP